MFNPNTDPVFSKQGSFQWSPILLAAANDFTGQSINNSPVFQADPINGSFLQTLRFKSIGTNVASVARIFVGNGLSPQQIITATGTPTGTPTAGVGSMNSGNHYAKIIPIGEGGDIGVASAESAAVAVAAGAPGKILWAWTSPGAGFKVSANRVYVGIVSVSQMGYFDVPVSSITASQTTTVLTVTDILSAPDSRICAPLVVGSVFASGIAAGTYIVNQLTSTESDGALGKRGTYTLSASASVASATCTTDPLLFMQLTSCSSFITSKRGLITLSNLSFVGEFSLPATTIAANAPVAPDLDYPINKALDPGFMIYVGLGTAVAAGWQVTAIGGKY